MRVLHYSDVENAYDDPGRIGRLAGLIDDRRAADTLVVGTGDNTAPGVLSLVTEGEQALDFFDAVRPDAETFGNHDFDYGLERTEELVAASPQPWVSVNIELDGEPFGRDVGVRDTLLEERDGERVGFFGVLDADTPALNPEAAGLTVTDPYAAAADAADRLRDAGADHVVALSHLGRGDEELALAADVDAVLGGHVHSERIEYVDDVLLTRPGVGGRVLLEIDFSGVRPTATRHDVSEGPLDAALADRLRRRMRDADLTDVVARVDDPIERTEATAFRGESRVGNFVADAYRWAADADVGLQNSGGIREGHPLAGDVTIADLVSVVPFDEAVAVAELTGEELEALLEHAAGSTLGFGEADWWHAHLSGASVTWDAAQDELVDLRVGGEAVAPDETYTLATTNYLFFSDEEFPVLDTDHRVAALDVQHEVLAAYAREHGIDPEIEGRVVRRGVNDQI
ncbi:bifunctional metallophosphatase/5'-nucleotidase [Halocalculus aciditolerans]|uniref:2',3'-cyclic-nucleotide 2'-phosphodiesterase n=1 Tax=Halocalculus aciditolerans TaxID=1383812 RepID=A0A830F1D4_9EURY|nr:5'-nucleotidase C-terminal domain-containing protein [Halocalculus aciditolerans]GGL52993.1 2',3'-cyclic-nucleotide 2'-phosphodiesterase [Halocalculus aciditolerans]